MVRFARTSRVGLVFAVVCCLSIGGVMSSPGPFEKSPPLTDPELDLIRGGFDLGSGVQIAFGFENRVLVNGEVISQSVFRLEPGMLRDAQGIVQFVREGAALQVVPDEATNLAVATVIQNALDAQSIQSMSILHASVTSLDFVRSMSLGDMLSGQTLGFRP